MSRTRKHPPDWYPFAAMFARDNRSLRQRVRRKRERDQLRIDERQLFAKEPPMSIEYSEYSEYSEAESDWWYEWLARGVISEDEWISDAWQHANDYGDSPLDEYDVQCNGYANDCRCDDCYILRRYA